MAVKDMTHNLTRVLLLMQFLMFTSLAAHMVSFPATSVSFTGRCREDGGTLQFDMPATTFKFTVQNTTQITLDMSQVGISSSTGTDHALKVSDNGFLYPNCFEVFIDGVFVILDPNEYHSFCTADWHDDGSSNTINITPENLDETKSHLVEVFKSTEAQYNSIVVEPNYITLNTITLFSEADPPSLIHSPDTTSRRIEFVGDSITAGYCNLCDETEESGVFAESHYESWPTLVSAQLNASFHSIAWSGYGLVNNCCGGNTTMPMVYPRALASVYDAMWDFSGWIPDAVVVNLGTNDVASGQYDETTFRQTYLSLLHNMTLSYGNIPFFLACGPMTNRYCDGVKSVIEAYNSDGGSTPTAYFLDQTSLDVKMQCCGHPTATDDIIMANYTANMMKSTLGCCS